jgi:EAL domain-containing protein (putative c-di-GMP-specific phosphodiesterase class I)
MAKPPAKIASALSLPDFVRDVAETHQDMRALRLTLSELRPDTWESDVIQAVEETLVPLARANQTHIFRLPRRDYLLCFPREQTDAVRAVMIRLRLVIPEDPLTSHLADPPGRSSPLVQWWSLDADFGVLRAMAKRVEDAAAAAATKRRSAGKGSGHKAKTNGRGDPAWRAFTGEADADADRKRPLPPLDAEMLERLVTGLDRADLSNHVRQQSVCAIVGAAPPKALFSEIYVSINRLREAMAPNVDLAANRWLFQHFSETLDRRVLAWLNREAGGLLKTGFSININVGSILSDAFLRFEQQVSAALHGTVILELRVEDVFADLEAYAFARDFVHQRGYRICLDSLTPEVMALLNRERLGVDIMKLFWHPDLPEEMRRGHGPDLAERLREHDGNRTILARCDDPAALELGRSLGITMFQGRYMDKLLSGTSAPVPLTRPR